jgi:hypothetical protein
MVSGTFCSMIMATFYITTHNCLQMTAMFFISQDCRELHQAKDGDGWFEQSFQPILFGMLHKASARLFQPLTSVIFLSFQGKEMMCSHFCLYFIYTNCLMTDMVLCIVLQPDLPHAYVCAERCIFDVTEWFSCQVIQIILIENSVMFINIFLTFSCAARICKQWANTLVNM